MSDGAGSPGPGTGEEPPRTPEEITPEGASPRAGEREAFWGYSDLLLVIGLAFPAALSSAVVV
jgi:hypothetical protein